MSATFADAQPVALGWIDWLRRELAPSPGRSVRTAIMVCGAVLCVIISMALQVPELAVSAYMLFFISKENKTLTTTVGVGGLICVTIGIGLSLLLYKLTYGHPELRVPSIAMFLFLGMYLSRVLVLGPLGFLLGFIMAATQSIGELVPSPELLVRWHLWLWVALAYSVSITVLLNRLFLPSPTGPLQPVPKPKTLFVPDAFTNPAHVRFGLKVTLATMICYVFYCGVDWFGIHTAFITCVFIALESSGATLRKGILRAGGCVIGGLFALLSIVYLIPHMESIASLVVLVAAVSAIAGWVATGTERIAYGGLQIAFAFFYGLFPGLNGYAPDTDLDNVRNRVVGILLGLFVTAFIFHYIWPERAIDRLRDTLRQALGQLAKLLVTPSEKDPVNEARSKAQGLISQVAMELAQARRHAELTSFEVYQPRPGEHMSLGSLEKTLSQAERVFTLATSLTTDSAWQEWQELPPDAQHAEGELRNVLARWVRDAAEGERHPDADLSTAFARWNETIQERSLESDRIGLVSQIAAATQELD